ncbi:MAG TPA: 2-amino-4-hydroxy-6-hydroxymethyldihydropteridine diphosphokinase [Gammaproteobacteria bacterium]|nr:2-amino-4-hydroxy-6-hydroxymethyldihydropteridine diphosphokinase [Gammaproteobacteria bacterium]
MHVPAALQALRKIGDNFVHGGVYESPAQGFDGPAFYNMVVALETDLSADALVERLHAIEDAQARTRKGEKFSSRTLDLDLLLLGDEIVSEGPILLPHPDIATYAHVIVPLVALVPECLDPSSGRRYADVMDAMRRRDPEQFSALRLVELPLERSE